MKKTVLALCFALLGTAVFAQAPKQEVLTSQFNGLRPVGAVDEQNNDVQYRESIFKGAKGAGDVLFECDFSQEGLGYLVQNVVDGKIDGKSVAENSMKHEQNEKWGAWTRFSGYELSYLNLCQWSSNYPRLNTWFGGKMAEALQGRLDTSICSAANGWMIMDVFDQSDINGKAFNSAIRFFVEGIDTSVSVIDVQFYQWYMKFYDQCYVDFSTNNREWTATEINVTGVDVDVNSTLSGVFTYTLPLDAVEAAQQNDGELYIRLRWYSNVSATTDGYGYCWIVDDFKVLAGGENRLSSQQQYFTAGAYQLVPQGMQLPLYWHAKAVNNGSKVQKYLALNIYNYYGNDPAERIGCKYYERLEAGDKVDVQLDQAGYASASGSGSGSVYGWFCQSSRIINNAFEEGSGTGYLNTDNVGANYVYASLKSYTDKARENVNLSYDYDTTQYFVTDSITSDEDPDFAGCYIWGHDNGVLTVGQAYIYGHIIQGTNTYITEASSHYMYGGYQVSVRYTMDSVLPRDEQGRPWVIRGVEYVPATDSIIRSGNATISPSLTFDSCTETGESFYSNSLKTGVTSISIDSTTIDPQLNVSAMYEAGYLKHGQYSTIRVAFPEQPELVAGRSYRIGYTLAEDGKFAVASSNGNYYWTKIGDSVVSHLFSEDADEEVRGYATRFARSGMVDNAYDVKIYNPKVADGYRNLFAGNYYGRYPMIHLIVGPRVAVQRVQVSAVCTDNSGNNIGSIQNNERLELCGNADSVVVGSASKFYITPSSTDESVVGKVVSILMNGEELWSEENGFADGVQGEIIDGDALEGFTIELTDIQEDVVFEVEYDQDFSNIYSVANNVNMTLQPNPATDQVRLSVEGVEGMVECSIIDMSGRSVYNSKFDAETSHTVNLSNMAKGAYFVRINNSVFSKVEKMIVR